jgi:signal transduction histidine kinase
MSLLLIAAVLFYGWTINKRQASQYLGSISKEKEIMTKNFALMCADYLLVSDYAGMETFLMRAAESMDIREITVYEKTGTPIASIRHESGDIPRVVFSDEKFKGAGGAVRVVKDGRSLIVHHPILSGSVGWISVKYSLEHLYEMQATVFRYSLFIAFLGITIGCLILMLCIRPITNEIRFLTNFAKRLSESKGEQIPIRHCSTETEELAVALNDTSLKLAAAESGLKELNRTLEQRVAEEVEKGMEKDHLLIQQSRLAAMGEMLANIAHQWRQPLNAVGLIIQDFRDAYAYGELNKEYLDKKVEKGVEIIMHMSKTIDDFRNFFRPEKEKQTFLIREPIIKAASFIEAAYKHNGIELEIEIADDITAEGYPNEYAQVVLNILNNAKDALMESGAAKPRVSIRTFKENEKAVLTISDNAGGIPQDIIERIFDPYFTTKEEGKGTGIGLYMSKMIIEKNMSGKLTARNTNGGAEFRIEI